MMIARVGDGMNLSRTELAITHGADNVSCKKAAAWVVKPKPFSYPPEVRALARRAERPSITRRSRAIGLPSAIR